MEKIEFWIDELAKKVFEKFSQEKEIHLSCGLSIRGPQHIGRIRGELCIPHGIKRVLENNYGKKAIHYIVLYDMDGLKEKGAKNGFPNDPQKQKKYVGVSLFNVEDPFGCHKNWQEHFWEDFGNYLDNFGFEVKIVKTSEFYKMDKTKKLIKWILENKEKVINEVNKFRGRNPWPKDHIPVNPICQNCLSINHTKAISVNIQEYTVKYKCEKCGFEGETSLENAKLNWRLEWPALWKVLHIEFEPYGKDHAAAGGSRETCGHFSKVLFDYDPPLGEWNEWVSLKMNGKNLGEMTASGFVGITPKEWLEVADAEILRYLYYSTRPHTTITIDMDNIFIYFDRYDRAERIYFGGETEDNEKETINIKRSYELSQIQKPRQRIPPQVPFTFASLLGQIFDPEKNKEKLIQTLRRTGHLKGNETQEELEYVLRRIKKALNWVLKYAPEKFRFKLLEKPSSEILEKLTENQKKSLREFSEHIHEISDENSMWKLIKKTSEKNKINTKQFFESAYLVLLGKTSGPRLFNIISALGKDSIKNKFSLF